MNERESERREGERRILETDLLMMVPFPYIITAWRLFLSFALCRNIPKLVEALSVDGSGCKMIESSKLESPAGLWSSSFGFFLLFYILETYGQIT